MIKGTLCSLRHLQAADLATYIALVNDLPSRGAFFSPQLKSPEAIRRDFMQTGFVTEDSELFVSEDRAHHIVGVITHFKSRTPICREIGYRLFDAALAGEAHGLGVGADFTARFNRNSTDYHFAPPLTHPARVLALSDGDFLGRRGMLNGSWHTMGPSALLDLGGVRVAVISQRQQLIDPAQLDVLGVDLDSVCTLVVKSRGHFRAAFEGFAPPDRILEVDCPGLTTPNLKTLPWTRLPRPIFPIDQDVTWNP